MKYSAYFAMLCVLACACSQLTQAQQYMKSLPNVDDAHFDGWVRQGKLTKCHAIAPAAYPDGPSDVMAGMLKPSGICYWDIDRAAEVAPPALTVHAGTRILIRVQHPRQNEILLPTVVFAKVVPPSPGNDVLKNAVNPLQTIAPTPAVRALQLQIDAQNFTLPPNPCQGATLADIDPDACQTQLIPQINSAQDTINRANAILTCLENYQAVPQPAPATLTPCSFASPIVWGAPGPNGFASQKGFVLSTITNALAVTVPLGDVSNLDNYFSCTTVKCDTRIAHADAYAKNAEIKNAITAIQAAQATLQQAFVTLSAIPDTNTSQFYYFDVPRLTTATATITGTEIVSKTASTISTWTTSATSYNIVVSAGLGFSNLVNRTYANTPEIQNGMPVLNSSGNVISMVTETDTKMTVMAPEILGSILIPGLRRFSASCSFGCSLLVSGGVGANLTSKTADFDTGISLRLADFLITPSVHFGRESRLIDGIYVGEQIGANAPSTLPTATKWVRKFGLVLTYVIPLT